MTWIQFVSLDANWINSGLNREINQDGRLEYAIQGEADFGFSQAIVIFFLIGLFHI
jgi:hypothetical protein